MSPSAAPPNTQPQWLTIDDFSPGIEQRIDPGVLIGTSPGRLGAAQIDNTYRCIALPRGGLGPLPKRHYSYDHPDFGDSNTRFTEGFHIFGPLKRYADTVTFVLPDINQDDVNIHPVEFYLAFGVESAGAHHDIIEAIPVFADPATTETFQLEDVNTAYTLGKFPPVYFATFSANNAVPTTIGDPKIAWSRNVLNKPAAVNTRVQFFPDLAVPSPFVTEIDILGGIIEAHQSRLVNIRRVVFDWYDHVAGVEAQATSQTEVIAFTGLNVTDFALGGFLDIAGETRHGFGCVASLSASDILFIRHQGGAYLVQGDIGYPTVRRLPGVTSTYGTECHGISTSIGFVYGVNNGGVQVWQGAQDSQSLSPTLDDTFWLAPNASNLQSYRGDFAQWKNLIVTPNNWVFDILTKSWWRLDNPDDMQFLSYKINPVNNVMYAALCFFSDASPTAVVGFSPKEGASDYSWQSQPLSPTIQRIVNIRETQIVVQGSGSVTITYTGSAIDVSTTFDIPASAGAQPILLRKHASWTGTHLQVRIEASNPAGPAPIVHAWRAEYMERQQEVFV